MTPSAAARILVVDDELDLRVLYEMTLRREGYQVDTAGTVAAGLQALHRQGYDVLITDMNLPDGSGLALLRAVLAPGRREHGLVITAYGSAENAVTALKAGAFDYLAKPVDLRQLRQVVASALKQPRTPSTPPRPLTAPDTLGPPAVPDIPALQRLIGNSEAMHAVRDRILRIASSMAPVLIHGESGTGKELAARAVHACSHRADKPFVAVNCGAIPENLLEAEFFGARKGAYTGATQDRPGFFQAAHGGTLFLDEIGDLPLSMQAKLLRAIQERQVRPIGSPHELAVDVRIVSATHKDLATSVNDGNFRHDLFYRLNVIDIVLPALRERREDIPMLCATLLARIARDSGQPPPRMDDALLGWLMAHPLRGNVRELENLLHRSYALGDGHTLHAAIDPPSTLDTTPSGHRAGPAPPSPMAASLPPDLQAHLDAYEAGIIERALKEHHYNRTATATRLGLSLRQIRYRIARLNITMPGHESDKLTLRAITAFGASDDSGTGGDPLAHEPAPTPPHVHG
ncbi:MAG: Regulatory protein AtoC [Paracidovorax wautersii]|uniref:Regulatory protein AtoC n=1 Tax=Paracidovorax wautersii TaxID=1177982 RepID=A0A7V8FMC8_9BURK|nr:MAG: Regulatory protein AtoC [Paracidovorax wautersii]